MNDDKKLQNKITGHNLKKGVKSLDMKIKEDEDATVKEWQAISMICITVSSTLPTVHKRKGKINGFANFSV